MDSLISIIIVTVCDYVHNGQNYLAKHRIVTDNIKYPYCKPSYLLKYTPFLKLICSMYVDFVKMKLKLVIVQMEFVAVKNPVLHCTAGNGGNRVLKRVG